MKYLVASITFTFWVLIKRTAEFYKKFGNVTLKSDYTTERSHNIKTENSSFESPEQFKYLGKILTNQNSVQVEIKSRLKSGKACYLLVQHLLSSSML